MQRKEILNEIENNPSILQEIDKKYLSDEEFMLSILKMKPILAYRFIDDSLLSNKNFIEKALLLEKNFFHKLVIHFKYCKSNIINS